MLWGVGRNRIKHRQKDEVWIFGTYDPWAS
jgi:hypothetical protein